MGSTTQKRRLAVVAATAVLAVGVPAQLLVASPAAAATTDTSTARFLTLTPEYVQAVHGNAQPVVATVMTAGQVPVQGLTVTFVEDGTGRFRNGASQTSGVTDAYGRVTVEVVTMWGEIGPQRVVASIPAESTACDEPASADVAAGSCTDAASVDWYGPTVAPSPEPTPLATPAPAPATEPTPDATAPAPSPSPSSATTTVSTTFEDGAGGELATGDTATAEAPVQTAVVAPAGSTGGTISIETTTSTQTAQAGYAFLGQQVNIVAPVATAENPLVLTFTVDASLIPAGTSPEDITLTRSNDGPTVQLTDCTSDPTAQPRQAVPDPCVSARILDSTTGDVQIVVLTSHASAWNLTAQTRTPRRASGCTRHDLDNRGCRTATGR